MRTVFLVPIRKDNGHRDALWKWCRARWEAEMPDVPIYEGEHTDGPFNRSAAINLAARLADTDGRWDVAVVIDNDVFLSIDNVRAAIASAADGKVTWAHRRWRNVAERNLKRLLADPDPFGQVPRDNRDMDLIVDVTNPISWSCCVAVPRATFDDMGGFDERFVGWGFEDGAWAALVRALYPWSRVQGTEDEIKSGHYDLYHLHHDRTPERIILGESRSTASSDYVRNALLGRRYMVAAIRDHAAGDQPGEERLSADMVAVHVRNLTLDDARFLDMAKERRMPEADWAKWWPSLEELRDGAKAHKAGPEPTVTLIVHTGGESDNWPQRSKYLRQSLASLATNVTGPIVQRRIYSDWGSPFLDELRAIGRAYDFIVVGPDRHVGYAQSMALELAWITNHAKGTHVFRVEDDFVYERPVDLVPMLETLQANPQLRQLALLREAAYPREMEAGGVIESLETPVELRNHRPHPFLEHRDHFTANPSLFHRALARNPWPVTESSERKFGDSVLRDQTATFGYWGSGETWIRHIGEVRAAAAY